jgi:hypothetical protein
VAQFVSCSLYRLRYEGCQRKTPTLSM